MHTNRNNKGQVKILDQKYYLDQSKVLGSGACGSVYFGWQTDDVYLAIKSIPINAKFEISDSMLMEINLLRKLTHPNIVKFIDAKKTKDYMYLIMEFCNEGTLEDLILKQNISEIEILDFFRQICKAFKVLHENNILHGDVKPSNILLHNSQCKLADFGVSKSIDRNRENLTLRGTLAFMSPQILNNQPYTTKSDIWSLGITLFFMFFKSLPWGDNFRNNNNKLRQFISNEYNPDKFFLHCSSSISEFSLQLLKKMMVVEENNRISWDDLFELVIGKEEMLREENLMKELSKQRSGGYNQNHQNQIITRQSVDFRRLDNEYLEMSQELEDLYRNPDFMMKKYYYKNEITLKAKEARIQLELEIYKAQFFEDVAKQIDEQRISIPQIPGGLYEQCLFLLRKRSYISYRNLYEMISFSSQHKSGNIEINEELWEAFHTAVDWKLELQRFQTLIFRRSTESKKRKFIYLNEINIINLILSLLILLHKVFSKSKDEMNDAFYNLPDFKQKDRGDAYNDSVLEETENLILAFNDTMIQLFIILADKLFVLKKDQKRSSKINLQVIANETKVNPYLVYDLISVILFRQIYTSEDNTIKLSTYNEKKKKSDLEELLYRIEIAHNSWKNDPEYQFD